MVSRILGAKASKIIFASPDTKLGNEVHWTIEDYDKPAPANNNVSTPHKSKFDWEAAQDNGNIKVASAMKMNFWLAKGGATHNK
jgi:hypothetical protein